MSTKNRADRIQRLHKTVIKHFTPVTAPEDRSVLEHVLYACCLEDASYDDADEAFLRLQESFFDWNEVRVTTITELRDTLHNLPNPTAAATRVKKNLQSLFETRYSFALDDMVKMNLGKAVQELENMAGMTKFVLGYVTQNALGGHAIPISKSIMSILLAAEIVTEAEAQKWLAPGLERTVPKTKGVAFASALHQLAVAAASSQGDKHIKAILKEAGVVEKKPAKKAAAAKTTKKAPGKKSTDAAATAKSAKKTVAPKKAAASKSPASKAASKKATAKKATAPKAKAASKKSTAKSATKKQAKRKPR
jgi:endonuclease-3